MSLDLGSPALEIAIALSFVFFLLSLIVSGCTEFVAWVTKRRSRNLVRGIEGLLGDETVSCLNPEAKVGDGGAKVSDKVLAHPLLQSDNTTPADKKRPSYVSARNFATALIETVRSVGGTAGRTYSELRSTVEKLPEESPLGMQLRALLADADSSVADYRKSLEGWFDDSMDRVSGWYKRWSQAVTVGFAIVVAVGLNASAIRIVERLDESPAVRAAVVEQADAAVESSAPEAAETPQAAGDQIEKSYTELKSLKLPLMWSHENVPWVSWKAFGLSLLGWLITAAALSLGAPFWFDALGRLSRLRTTGKRPEGEAGPQT